MILDFVSLLWRIVETAFICFTKSTCENNNENKETLQKVLQVLDMYFNEICEIDKSVFNAARITKLYGTTARKGNSSEQRPHRESKVLRAPSISQTNINQCTFDLWLLGRAQQAYLKQRECIKSFWRQRPLACAQFICPGPYPVNTSWANDAWRHPHNLMNTLFKSVKYLPKR